MAALGTRTMASAGRGAATGTGNAVVGATVGSDGRATGDGVTAAPASRPRIGAGIGRADGAQAGVGRVRLRQSRRESVGIAGHGDDVFEHPAAKVQA